LGWVVWSHPPGERPEPSQSAFDLGGPPLPEPYSALDSRPVYPYSVIPGGVENRDELREAIARDPAVASHYRDFDLRVARIIRLQSPRAVYVSYRLQNEIFWTRRRIRLPAGEELITDGVHSARARCGNRIAAFRRAKVSALEPPLRALEPPEVPPLAFRGFPRVALLEQLAPPLVPPALSEQPFGPILGPFIPLGGFLLPTPCVPPKRSPGSPPSSARNPCAPPPCTATKTRSCQPASVTPEPGTLLLFLSGAAFLVYRHRAAKARRLAG
jgi:hypothetical protein